MLDKTPRRIPCSRAVSLGVGGFADDEGVRKGGGRGRAVVGGGPGEVGRTEGSGIAVMSDRAGEDILMVRKGWEGGMTVRSGRDEVGMRVMGLGFSTDMMGLVRRNFIPLVYCHCWLIAALVFGFISHRGGSHRVSQTCNHVERSN